MSSSPVCTPSPGYTFPPQNDYFNLGNDYFKQQGKDYPNSLFSSASSSASYFPVSRGDFPKTHNDSISSIGSDSTVCERSVSSLSSSSCDTLVSKKEVDSRKNHLNLSLNLKLLPPRTSSRHRYNQSLLGSSSYPLLELDETIEAERSSSAVESRFPIHEINEKSVSLTRVPERGPPPQLKKQVTLPTLSLNQPLTLESVKNVQLSRTTRSLKPQSFRQELLDLSPHVSYISIEEVVNLISSTTYDPATNLPNFLMVDIRPFADYIKSHIRDAINVCLPLTLLKRSNFSFRRCINSLPVYDRLIFQNYLKINEDNIANGTPAPKSSLEAGKFGLPALLIYENYNNSQNVYHMVKKILDNSSWNSEAQPPIYLLDFEFSEFALALPDMLECGKSDRIDVESLPIQSTATTLPNTQTVPFLNNKFRSSSLSEVPLSNTDSLKLKIPQGPFPSRGSVSAVESCGPTLSNFTLPTIKSKFKIRHNEETFDMASVDSSFKLQYSTGNVYPAWIKESTQDEKHIVEEFKLLEENEKRRLNLALSVGPKTQLTPGGSEELCSISCGMDYGYKNRYKDIFLYDHSRVKLHDAKLPDNDYINASYINPICNLDELINPNVADESVSQLTLKMKYIATQGPLADTIGDFWKLVLNHKTPVIISLTNEFENGVTKCAPFWIQGTYRSEENQISVGLVKEQRIQRDNEDYLVIRNFRVSMDGMPGHEVLQIHLLTWPDMYTMLTPQDILLIAIVKNYILNRLVGREYDGYSSVVHCSAGCGRTGTFCTIDSFINIFKFNGNPQCELKYNPTYAMVNNFRKQRISMVQTLRQYYFIYDTLLKFMNAETSSPLAWYGLTELGIVNEFIERLLHS